MKELFLDANAHVPMSKATVKVYADYQASRAGWGHPLAPSLPAQQAASALETARGKIANLLGAEDASHFIITNTCTQACEWGLGLLPSGTIYHSGMEHSAIYQRLELLTSGYTVDKLSINTNGEVEIPNIDLKEALHYRGEFHVVCSHVQNEIGIIQPLRNLKPRDGLLFSDMCQSPGKVSVNLKEIPVDIATFGAHKWGGPASVGLLYLRDTTLYKEFGTGSRYFNDRPGTHDVAAVVAAAAALEETLMSMPERLGNMQQFQTTLEERLQEMELEIIGKNAPRVANTTFVSIPGIAFPILAELSRKGIYVGMGSACGSMHTGPSLTMKTLGIEGDAHDFLRISQHGEYGKQDAIYLADNIFKLLKAYK